ncbi:MAG: type II toxin-antitoxin system MqsA family antitoxin [Candidatus Rokubacteria bacterium]|nr:type II toxin-antitoxin system MqsA family antitoxin [Candidatus Rokubacteria bacterium]
MPGAFARAFQSMNSAAARSSGSRDRGTLERGTTTATFDAEGTTVVVRNVPAEICNECGEGHFDAITTERVLELAAEAAGWSGAPVQICDYE